MFSSDSYSYENFSSLSACAGTAHAFFCRQPGVDVNADKDDVIRRLTPAYHRAVRDLGFAPQQLVTAEQVHGARLAEIEAPVAEPLPGVDGLLTRSPDVLLGIHVADCGAIYVVDPVRKAIALLHSGKKGTELGILPAAIARMAEVYGSEPGDLIVQLSPCIRPPAYEIDFASEIRRQAKGAGVPTTQFHDTGTCTARHPDRYYSYRIEKGKTGRMLALLGIRPGI
ncbi:MAG: polyphenol oxidase family protein [Verrucomicrobiota bacterium]